MKTATLKRTINFKFGQSLRKGTKVEITQINENTVMVRKPNKPTVEYIVSKDALDNLDAWFKVKVSRNTENEFLSILDNNGMDERNFVQYKNRSGMVYAIYEVYAKSESELAILKYNSDKVTKQS